MLLLLLFLAGGITCRNSNPQNAQNDLTLLNEVATNDIASTLEEIHFKGGLVAAEYYLDTAFHQKESQSVYQFYRYYYYKAYIYNHFTSNHNAALNYITVLIDRLEKDKVVDAMAAEAYFVKGDTYILMRNFPMAYRYYSFGIRICKMLDSKVAKNRLFDRFGLVLYRQNYFNEAKNYFLEAYNEFTPADSTFIPMLKKQELLDNIGLCYIKLGKLDSADLFYDSCLAILNKFNPQWGVNIPKIKAGAQGVVYGNKAKVFLKRGNQDTAIELYRKSIQLTLYSKEGRDACYSLVHLADIYLDQKKTKEADHIIDTLEMQLNRDDSKGFAPDFTKLVLRLKRTSAIHKEDWKSAALYADKHLNIIEEDGSGTEKKDADINDVLSGFEKEQQMTDLRTENQFSRNITVLIAVLFLLAVIIVVIVYFSWRNSRNRAMELEMLNRRIEEQKVQLEENNSRLEQLNQQKDKILSIAAHDLRNPVAAVKSISLLLEEEESLKDNEEVRMYLNLMAKASDGAIELINEILILANLKSAKAHGMEAMSINKFLQVTVDLLKTRAAEKQIELVILPSLPDVEVKLNEERFRRAISNLLVNAIKFSNPGKKVWIGASVLADRVHVYVKDEGIGIPDHLKGQVFDTFSTAKRAGTQDEPAYGLGLSIVKQIVGEHNGSVWFESVERSGTTFYIALPAWMG